jgi:hypothetical protein
MQDELVGVSAREIANTTGVDITTARRWRRGAARIPEAARRLLALRLEGSAEALLGPAWAGWRFGRDGLLYAPGWRRGFEPGEILAMPYLYGQVAALKRAARDALQARRRDRRHQRAARSRSSLSIR